ncbi:MAG: putative tricarboxylic transport rane protein [Bradyrhizobium sp.]|jgi:tripartite-type tricarboxylate transporter receptor subunit TctC|nr:putative tricarboxylic transport rane protein [Bradyrhizobium sp.]
MAWMIHRRTAIATAIAGGALVVPMVGQRGWARDSYQTSKTGRIVVPFAAGGTADCLGRVVAQILAESTSSTFVVENRTGAGGNVSAEIVAKAMPDGRTLLLGTVGTAVTNQYLYKYVPYDSEWSFTPIALVGEVTNVVVVHPTFPAGALGEFIDFCKKQGSDKVSYGSPAVGGAGHLSMEYLQGHAGIKLKHVAYVSRSRMIKDLLGRPHPDRDGQPATVLAAHPVRRATGSGRKFSTAMVRRARCAEHCRAGFPRLCVHALVVYRSTRGHAAGTCEEAFG